MKKITSILPRWFPAVLIMLAIFAFSSQPADRLPDFLNWDYLVKKASHMIGYGLLAWGFLHYWRYDPKYYRFVWLACVLYAATDEFHQAFMPGRSSSVFDVVIFDNLGTIFALWCHARFFQKAGD